jgi:small subunit ribosomal protein S17
MVKKTDKQTINMKCNDKYCFIHGSEKVKLRGRTFEGEVIKKLHGRVTIQFERMMKLRKYERYEKRKTKLHARLPDCMKDSILIGDRIQIAETRPISKTIHFMVFKIVKTTKSGRDQQ